MPGIVLSLRKNRQVTVPSRNSVECTTCRPHHRAGGRGPNTAVPTRTIVAPSAIAASKSPLIPIDSSRETQARRRARAAWRSTGRGSPASGGTVISPCRREPDARRRVDERRRVGRRQPPFCSSPATFTWTSTRRRAHGPRSRRRARPGRPTATASTHGTSWLTLLRCSRPMKCHGGAVGRERRRLRHELLRAVLARVVTPAATTRAHRVDSTASLVTATSRTVVRTATAARAAAAMRSRTSASVRDRRVASVVTARRRRRAGRSVDHHAVAAGDAVAPVREVVGRRRRCTRRGLELVDTRSARTRGGSRAADVERGRARGGGGLDLGPEPRAERGEVVGAELVVRRRGCTGRGPRAPGRCRAAHRGHRRLDHAVARARVARRAPPRRRCRWRARSARSRRRSRPGPGPARSVADRRRRASWHRLVARDVHRRRRAPGAACTQRCRRPDRPRAREHARRLRARPRVVADVVADIARVVRRRGPRRADP